jgi:hypothetical protein
MQWSRNQGSFSVHENASIWPPPTASKFGFQEGPQFDAAAYRGKEHLVLWRVVFTLEPCLSQVFWFYFSFYEQGSKSC